ncbi:hypothetical protein SLA_1832 [Streptomyces laurentii]|uniref:Uncharacterized protein n=1 Tax=Streptomyces laurentii TaxID=39478 RepID=A0A160NY60_STRLU|nr:hypothetical protein SLA_1832 [Streptomyces laurentii]
MEFVGNTPDIQEHHSPKSPDKEENNQGNNADIARGRHLRSNHVRKHMIPRISERACRPAGSVKAQAGQA